MIHDVEKSRFDRLKLGRHLNACRTDSLSEMAFAMELDGGEETADEHFGLWDCELGQIQQSRLGTIEEAELKKELQRRHSCVAVKSCLKNPLGRGRDSMHQRKMGVLNMMGSHMNPADLGADFDDDSDLPG